MLIKEISEDQINNFFLSDPSLMLLGVSDEESVYIYKNKKYPINEGSTYRGLFIEDDMVALFKYEYFTTHCINLHCYIKSCFQHQNLTVAMRHLIEEWLKENTEIFKVLFMVPDNCPQVHRVMGKVGFKKEGHITQCYKWREEKVGLVIYGLDITDATI